MVHPNDRAAVDEAVQAALDGADEFVFVARVQGEHDWVWTRGRGVCVRDDAGTPVSISGTHQDITEAKLAEVALEDCVRPERADAGGGRSPPTRPARLEDVLSQARSLVLLHDDWERARGFVPAADGSGVVPLYVSDEDRAADAADPGDQRRRARARQPGVPRARPRCGTTHGSPSPSRSPSPTRCARSSRSPRPPRSTATT